MMGVLQGNLQAWGSPGGGSSRAVAKRERAYLLNHEMTLILVTGL